MNFLHGALLHTHDCRLPTFLWLNELRKKSWNTFIRRRFRKHPKWFLRDYSLVLCQEIWFSYRPTTKILQWNVLKIEWNISQHNSRIKFVMNYAIIVLRTCKKWYEFVLVSFHWKYKKLNIFILPTFHCWRKTVKLRINNQL